MVTIKLVQSTIFLNRKTVNNYLIQASILSFLRVISIVKLRVFQSANQAFCVSNTVLKKKRTNASSSGNSLFDLLEKTICLKWKPWLCGSEVQYNTSTEAFVSPPILLILENICHYLLEYYFQSHVSISSVSNCFPSPFLAGTLNIFPSVATNAQLSTSSCT